MDPNVQQDDLAQEERAWARLAGLLALNTEEAEPDENPRCLDADLARLHASRNTNSADPPNAGAMRSAIIVTAVNAIAANDDRHMEDNDEPMEVERPILWTDKRSDRIDKSAWYPFKNKMKSNP
ncbi:hypothetical protein PtA15_14A187 [Puccinia triticina]|uniref:Uncharacterized protein n=1 Tax=Puccinia triticina TaxID=208348 RepID=A0ABY7D352_9BASI|nr:uncharacterized protein PtA15_14A187 [Puccinia triticina]WAQ91305.1 hypothetical protein PtA15_14A187 [Puccinia triticina]